MKNLILIFAMLCGLQVNAQLVYDFNKKDVSLNNQAYYGESNIKDGTKLVVKILNVNRLLFNVNVSVTNVEFFSTAAGATTTNPNVLALSTEISPFVNRIVGYKATSYLLDYNNTAFKKLSPKEQDNISNDYLAFEDILYKRYFRFKAIMGIFKKRDNIFTLAKVDGNTLAANGWTFDPKTNAFINDTQTLYDEAMGIYNDLYKAMEIVKGLETYATPSGKAAIDEFVTKTEGAKYDTALDSYRVNHVNISPDVFSYQTDQPTEISGDEAVVTVAITPRTDLKDNSAIRAVSSETKIYHIPVIGGWRISFATGLFMSKLTQPRYTFKDTYKTRVPDNGAKTQFDTTAYRTIMQDYDDSWAMGVSALMYYGIRWNKMNEFAFHVGIGTVLQSDFKPNYFYGISYLRGYKRRFAINVGFAMGQQTILSETADLSRRYDPATTTIPTTTKTVFNKFQFGISYNIFSQAPVATTTAK